VWREQPEVKTRLQGSAVADASTLNVLRKYLAILPDASEDAWLFASENPQQPLDYSNVFRRRIRPALKKVGLKWKNVVFVVFGIFQVLAR
jgi:hypothetical protein